MTKCFFLFLPNALACKIILSVGKLPGTQLFSIMHLVMIPHSLVGFCQTLLLIISFQSLHTFLQLFSVSVSALGLSGWLDIHLRAGLLRCDNLLWSHAVTAPVAVPELAVAVLPLRRRPTKAKYIILFLISGGNISWNLEFWVILRFQLLLQNLKCNDNECVSEIWDMR